METTIVMTIALIVEGRVSADFARQIVDNVADSALDEQIVCKDKGEYLEEVTLYPLEVHKELISVTRARR